MIPIEIKEYCDSWDQKLSDIKGNELQDIFNIYMSLFPKYNKLYNEASKRLVDNGTIQSEGGDKRGATENVVLYLGADTINDAFTQNNNQDNIEQVAHVINESIFSIILTKGGKPDRDKDIGLVNEIRSAQNEIRTRAILKVVYHVRCNIFHGSKAYHEYQRLLLDPLIEILKTITNLLYKKLSE